MTPTSLSGKAAIVTGASSGIGEATAIALAAAGARVALVARRADRLQALAAKIDASGGIALVVAADLTSEAAAAGAVESVRAHFGRVDLLVNSAGTLDAALLEFEAPRAWRNMFDTNVLATLYTTQPAIRFMREAGGGHIVCISSALVRAAVPGNTAYAMTKASLNSFAEGLRKELIPHRIRVTNVAPGAVESEIADHIIDPAARKALAERRARTQMLQSEDVANAILYALSQPAHVAINEILMRPAGQEF